MRGSVRGSSFVERPSSDAATDRFHYICDIAAGGIGRVELAAKVDGRFRRLFAIKRLKDGYAEDRELLDMFLEEARIAGLVRHPNVVSVLDVGVDARGPFLAMDYVEGVSADALLRRAQRREEPLPVQLCLAVAIDAANGLHAAHETRDERGAPLMLVHRDVSPQNILVGYDGVSRVTDFGIAKALGRSTHTDTGVLKGKLGYMSPEQLRFEALDRRSDVFALGVVLYELLAGKRLYRSVDGAEGPHRILHEPPPDVGDVRPELPPELVECVFSMLAKERDARPSTAREVAHTLERVRAELVEVEGRLDVAELIEGLFGDRRRDDSARVAEAIERTDFGKPTGSPGQPATGRAATDVEPGLAAPSRRRGRWLAGVAVSAGIALAAWWSAPGAHLAAPRPAAGDGQSAIADEAPSGTAPRPRTEGAGERIGDGQGALAREASDGSGSSPPTQAVAASEPLPTVAAIGAGTASGVATPNEPVAPGVGSAASVSADPPQAAPDRAAEARRRERARPHPRATTETTPTASEAPPAPDGPRIWGWRGN